MSNTIPSANMALPVPVVGTDPGPQYATDLNSCLTIVDAHTHSPGSGLQITPTGLNINADLPFNNTNNITTLRSLRFTAQVSPIALPSDLGCLYESGVDLYYNDGAGNQIRITQGGNVSGSAGTITGLPSGTASAAYVSGSGTFQFLQSTSTAANIDGATLIVRYPGSYPTPSGNYIAIQAPSALASGYSITLPVTTPAANDTFLVMSTAGVIGNSFTVDNSSLYFNSSQLKIKPNGIVSSMLSAGSVSTTQIANSCITNAMLTSGCVAAANLAPGAAVGNISSGTVTAGMITTNVDLIGKSVRESGANVVVSNANATNSLSIIRGGVNSGGTPTLGEGFTVTPGATGVYTVNYNSAFGDTAVPVVTPFGATNVICFISAASTGAFTINFRQANSVSTGIATDFTFIVVGQRT